MLNRLPSLALHVLRADAKGKRKRIPRIRKHRLPSQRVPPGPLVAGVLQVCVGCEQRASQFVARSLQPLALCLRFDEAGERVWCAVVSHFALPHWPP